MNYNDDGLAVNPDGSIMDPVTKALAELRRDDEEAKKKLKEQLGWLRTRNLNNLNNMIPCTNRPHTRINHYCDRVNNDVGFWNRACAIAARIMSWVVMCFAKVSTFLANLISLDFMYTVATWLLDCSARLDSWANAKMIPQDDRIPDILYV